MRSYSHEVRRKQLENRIERIPMSGCWLWMGGRYASGYGAFNVDGKKEYAHRASYILNRGPIPEDKIVCHRCDVKMCVNPDHLYLGTHCDNAFDLVRAKGRFVSRTRKG